jgi:hypothetical protein
MEENKQPATILTDNTFLNCLSFENIETEDHQNLVSEILPRLNGSSTST